MKTGLFALAAALLALAAPLAAQAGGGYTTGQPQVTQFYFSFTWSPGGSIGECYSNCYPACLSACYASAPGGAQSIDCSACGGACAGSQCVYIFQPRIQADDAHPLGGTGITVGDDFSPVEPDQPPIGLHDAPLNCPAGTVPYSNIGCVDPNWKNKYCAQGNTCGRCAGLGGCIWTGVSCVACNAPTCIFACPAGPRVVAQPEALPAPETQPPLPGPPPAPTPRPTVLPLPTLVPTVTVPPGGGPPRPTVTVIITPQPTVLPTPPPLPTPTPGPKCNQYRDCKACANAPKDEEGEKQCGWSDFAGACIDTRQYVAVNNASLKAGWVSEERYCRPEDEPSVYCYEFSDCLSCAGSGGLKRRCQWSAKDNRCQSYNPLGDFRTEKKPEGNDILLPTFCPARDCGQITECRKCTQNSACLWSKSENSCVNYKGESDAAYAFYPSNCPVVGTPTPTPTPVPCPTGCTCDKSSRVLTCGGAPVDKSLLSAERAVQNAGAGTPIQRVEQVTLNPSGPAPSYTVRGNRDGLFLGFLPLHMPVTATVNAKTGAVERVDLPWWASLAG